MPVATQEKEEGTRAKYFWKFFPLIYFVILFILCLVYYIQIVFAFYLEGFFYVVDNNTMKD